MADDGTGPKGNFSSQLPVYLNKRGWRNKEVLLVPLLVTLQISQSDKETCEIPPSHPECERPAWTALESIYGQWEKAPPEGNLFSF